MAIAGKILGQVSPSATTNTTLYTVPSSTEVNLNLYICNRSAAATTIRVALRPNGDTIANIHYMIYDASISGNQTMNLTGIAMDATDVLTVYNTLATITFTATGLEST
jgi:hypothetical protein